MTKSLQVLNFLNILILFIISSVYGVSIHFFKDADFSDSILESSSNEVCNNTPRNKLADVYSIKTDTCLVAYFNPDCKSQWSVKYLPGDYTLSENDLTWIESFQVCSEKEGGYQLNIDIVKSSESNVATVLFSYKNICSCVNVPENVQKMRKWSIDNHHNAFLAYYDHNCSEEKWKPKFVAAGHNLDTNFMHEAKILDSETDMEYKIQSFGPDPDSIYSQTSCNLTVSTTENTMALEGVTEGVIDEHADTHENDGNVDLQEHWEDVNAHPHEHGMDMSIDRTNGGTAGNKDVKKRRTVTTVNLTKRFQALSTQFVELQSRIDQSTQNLENFHTNVMKKHKEEFNNFTETITELHQGFRNFTERMKLVMRELRNK